MPEVAVRGADMTARGEARSAAQHHLTDHELAVVFAESTGHRAETGIRRVRRLGPFPGIAEELGDREAPLRRGSRRESPVLLEMTGEWRAHRGALPLGFGRKPRAEKSGERVGFVIADVRDRLRVGELALAGER